MRDYLGYGATLATWFRGGELPTAVRALAHRPDGSAVDDQGIVIAEYPSGLSTLHSRWGTFTDPWVHQPQPACGFTVIGTKGTILSLDYSDEIRVQTAAHPEGRNVPVTPDLRPKDIFEELRRALIDGDDIRQPCDWRTSLAGQRIVDASVLSAATKQRVLLEIDR
jgi:glucose-fructose oxidoreductase